MHPGVNADGDVASDNQDDYVRDAASRISMVYQPVVELVSRRTVGFEALARFRGEPVRTPDVWFAEARGRGVGVELELAAVRRAIDVPVGLLAGRHLSVNVSPTTLADPALREAIAPMTPHVPIIVELTEHETIDDYDELAHATALLRSVGAVLAVDDAGAGFASMRHVLDLRPDLIKLDRTLVADSDQDVVRTAFVGALQTFAARVGVRLCAEGIETEAEAATVTELGVDLGQGYFFGRPAAIDGA